MSPVPREQDDERLWRRIRRVFRLPFNRARLDAEIDEELRFHLEGRVEDIMAAEGLNRAQAEAEARRRFGDYTQYRREAREIDATTQHRRERMELRETVARESGRALRTLRNTPGFTVVTVVTLALGIGAATAIFTLLDAVVLRPLPYRDAGRLVALSSPVPLLKGQTRWGVGRHEMYWFLDQGRTLESMGVYNTSQLTLLGSGADERPERIQWARVSASLFHVLGFTPQLGRLLTAEDNRMERPNVVVLGHAFWQRRFGGDPAVVGRTVSIEGFPVTVVGVLQPGATLPERTIDMWGPARVDPTVRYNNHSWDAIARLAPGVTAAQAERELVALTARMPEAYPEVYSAAFMKNTGFTTAVQPLRDAVVGEMVTRALWTLFGAVALVLLIAGANVANLFLVRIDARRRDVAVRTALGASRGHLAAQYLTESMLLAMVAGFLAVGIAQTMLRVLLTIAPSQLPRLAEVQLDGVAVAFALGVALLTGIVFGVLPLAGARPDVAVLRDAGRGLTTSRRRMRARHVLIATQMAIAVVLLASAALMLRTFQNLRGVDPGFDAEGVLTLSVALPQSRYGGDEVLTSAFYEQLASRVGALPGVQRAGFSDRMPLLSGDLCNGVAIEGATPETTRSTCPPTARVSPGYFETMGTRVEGRTPTWAGLNAGDGAIVVSRAFADHYWPGESAIGRGIRANGRTPPFYRVVGVAENVHGVGLDAPPLEMVYLPIRAMPGAPLWGPPTSQTLVVKISAGDPLQLVPAVTRIVGELDAQAAVANARTMESVLSRSIAKQSFTMVLLLIAATIAMLLSAVGIYGVISYVVAQRRGEIGVRVALGAGAGQVTGMVLRESLGIATLGVATGVLAAIGTTRFLRALLFEVSPGDPMTLALVPLMLLAVAAAASYLPARRASRVDPAEVLRSQ